jgi:hypothetical protein
MSSKHRTMKKSFETQMWVNGEKLPLNYFVQETLANTLMGFLKTLKDVREAPMSVEVKIKKLSKTSEVDAHTYP